MIVYLDVWSPNALLCLKFLFGNLGEPKECSWLVLLKNSKLRKVWGNWYRSTFYFHSFFQIINYHLTFYWFQRWWQMWICPNYSSLHIDKIVVPIINLDIHIPGNSTNNFHANLCKHRYRYIILSLQSQRFNITSSY